MTNKPYGTVLIKAAAILDFLANHPERTLQEIAIQTSLTPSTASKILDTLLLIGYVKKEAATKTYTLGTTIIQYANQNIDRLNFVETARPFLLTLQQQIDETIHLGVLENDLILYVDKLEPKHQTIFMSSKVGTKRALYSSAMGKAALSIFSEKECAAYLARTSLQPFTEQTITEEAQLQQELALIRQRQVAFDDEETEKDIFCFGTTILKEKRLIGTLSVSMPKYRLTDDLQADIIAALIQTKQAIETALVTA